MTAMLLAALLIIGGAVEPSDRTTVAEASETPQDAKSEKTKGTKDKAAPKKPKKAKKAKAPKAPVASPDEPLDEADGAVEAAQVVPGKPDVFVWKQHPSIRFGKAFRMDFQAKFQEDARASYPGAETSADLQTWEMHRNRIGVQGTAFKHIDFEVERELTEKELTEKDILEGVTPQSPWKDVYVNVDYLKNVQIQAGKFKIPFSLDQLIGVTQNDFVYRSLGANYLAPARDVGVMAHGRFFKHGLNYWTGFFKHDGDNARSKKILGGDETFAGRVTGTPFRPLSPLFETLEVGTSVTVTHVTDDSFRPNGLRGRTVMTQDTVFSPVYVKGARWRWGGDVDWMAGPGSVRAEYTQVEDERLNQGFGDEDLPKARYRSWYVSGTWLLTGEKKSRPVKPAGDFLAGGFGAVEVATRVERIWFDSVGGNDEPFSNPRAINILPSGVKAFTVGVNWSLNRFVKLQVNAIRERVEDLERSPVATGTFWSRVFRLQLVL